MSEENKNPQTESQGQANSQVSGTYRNGNQTITCAIFNAPLVVQYFNGGINPTPGVKTEPVKYVYHDMAEAPKKVETIEQPKPVEVIQEPIVENIIKESEPVEEVKLEETPIIEEPKIDEEQPIDYSNREVIINVDHLTKDYGFGRGVFDVSIKVHRGECYGYLGPNGAGKSTTIRHLMGFSKPQKGKTQILGINSFGNTDKILQHVGYLPGEPSIPQGLNGWGFLKMMQEMRGEYNDERVQYLLDLFKLDPSPNVKSMSLGEKRKLAVVAAFMNDPEVLILDEPTSGLDPVMQEVFIKFIIEEKKRGKTILLSSHIFSEVEAVCDNISIIKDGIHVSTFNASEIKKKDELTYIIRLQDKANFDDFVIKCPFEIVTLNRLRSLVTIKIKTEQYKEFLDLVDGINVDSFSERPFTLEDYFMSFYHEEKEFEGLKGVKGNQPKSKGKGKK